MADSKDARIAKILPLGRDRVTGAPVADRQQVMSHQVVRILRAMFRGVKSVHDQRAN